MLPQYKVLDTFLAVLRPLDVAVFMFAYVLIVMALCELAGPRRHALMFAGPAIGALRVPSAVA